METAIRGWDGAVGNKPWWTRTWGSEEQSQLKTSTDVNPIEFKHHCLSVIEDLRSKNKQIKVVHFPVHLRLVHADMTSLTLSKGWPCVRAVYWTWG